MLKNITCSEDPYLNTFKFYRGEIDLNFWRKTQFHNQVTFNEPRFTKKTSEAKYLMDPWNQIWYVHNYEELACKMVPKSKKLSWDCYPTMLNLFGKQKEIVENQTFQVLSDTQSTIINAILFRQGNYIATLTETNIQRRPEDQEPETTPSEKTNLIYTRTRKVLIRVKVILKDYRKPKLSKMVGQVSKLHILSEANLSFLFLKTSSYLGSYDFLQRGLGQLKGTAIFSTQKMI